MKRIIFTAVLGLIVSTYSIADTLIPRSVSGDKGKYYLIEKKKQGDVIATLHKRVGVETVDYTRLETNCKTMKMREIGTGEGSIKAIRVSPTKWFDLVEGSSKSDLAHFVCKK